MNPRASSAVKIVSTQPGVLYSVTGWNDGPEQWIQFLDSPFLPDDGPVVHCCPPFLVSAGAPWCMSLSDGIPFKRGCAICCSSTEKELTLGTGICFASVRTQACP